MGNAANDDAIVATTYDNESSKKPIAILRGAFKLNDYDPALIPPQSLKIKTVETVFLETKPTTSPAGAPTTSTSGATTTTTTEVDTYKVILYLTAPIPMEEKCFIQVFLPNNLSLYQAEKTKVKGYGFFDGNDGKDFTPSAFPKKKKSFVIKGCNSSGGNFDGIGAEPYGRLVINHVVKNPKAKGTGGHFRIRIYSSEKREANQLVARLDQGPDYDITQAVDKGHGSQKPRGHSTKKNSRIAQMYKKLGDILLKLSIAEQNGDTNLKNDLQTQSDALISVIQTAKSGSN